MQHFGNNPHACRHILMVGSATDLKLLTCNLQLTLQTGSQSVLLLQTNESPNTALSAGNGLCCPSIAFISTPSRTGSIASGSEPWSNHQNHSCLHMLLENTCVHVCEDANANAANPASCMTTACMQSQNCSRRAARAVEGHSASQLLPTSMPFGWTVGILFCKPA
jgi:hypothetical protein